MTFSLLIHYVILPCCMDVSHRCDEGFLLVGEVYSGLVCLVEGGAQLLSERRAQFLLDFLADGVFLGWEGCMESGDELGSG